MRKTNKMLKLLKKPIGKVIFVGVWLGFYLTLYIVGQVFNRFTKPDCDVDSFYVQETNLCVPFRNDIQKQNHLSEIAGSTTQNI